MSGLELIQNRIITEAKGKAEKIMDQAVAQAEEMISEAVLEKDRLLDEADAKSREQAQAMIRRAQGAASMESRRILLQARQDLIEEAMKRALGNLVSLPDKDKLDLYKALVLDTGEQHGAITLSESDAQLADRLIASLGSAFAIASADGTFAGGLILKIGSIEDNLTFERLMTINRPHLVRLAAETLAEEL